MWFTDHPEAGIALLGWIGSAIGIWVHLSKQRASLEATVTELRKDVDKHLGDCEERASEGMKKRSEYDSFRARTEEQLDTSKRDRGEMKQTLERMERKMDDILSGVYGVPRSHGTRRSTDEGQ